jgi:hypothetical protein
MHHLGAKFWIFYDLCINLIIGMFFIHYNVCSIAMYSIISINICLILDFVTGPRILPARP